MFSLKNQSNEVCRMPWFLVEVRADETASKSGIEYFIVHSVDINELLSSNMYIDGVVKFDHNQRIVEGHILLASEDRSFVEQEMRRLTSAMETNKRKGRLFFVQYSNTSTDLVHAVITEKEILFPVEVQPNPGELFIKVAQNQYRATVLLMSEDREQMENEFEKLKNWCLQKCLNEGNLVQTSNSTTEAGNWILVQYSRAPLEVGYVILNERETHWNEQNLYKDVVTYINVGEMTFQALILEKSSDYQSLIVQLNNFKECAALRSLFQMGSFQNSASINVSMTPFYQPYSDKMMST